MEGACLEGEAREGKDAGNGEFLEKGEIFDFFFLFFFAKLRSIFERNWGLLKGARYPQPGVPPQGARMDQDRLRNLQKLAEEWAKDSELDEGAQHWSTDLFFFFFFFRGKKRKLIVFGVVADVRLS